MSGTPGCSGGAFLRSGLPACIFGSFDATGVEHARRERFLRRRQDSEFLEVIAPVYSVSADLAPAVVVSVDVVVLPRRSRRLLGLDVEYESLAPVPRRPRLK